MSEAAGGPDFGLLTRQAGEALSEFRIMRRDVTAMSAVLWRMNGTLAGLVNELRATRISTP